MIASKLARSFKSDPRLRDLCGRFLAMYGDGPLQILRAPARINLLGEHIDYVGYLPTASLTFGSAELDMVLMFRPSASGTVRGATTLPNHDPFTLDLADAAPGHGDVEPEWERHLYSLPPPPPHWGNYARGAMGFARFKHGERVRQGIEFLVDSSIPPAGGASSSSALTVLAGAAILRANGIPFDSKTLALDSARAEWFIGTRGGNMDHLTICLSRAGNLIHIGYADNLPRLVPFPDRDARVATFFTHPADKSKEIMLEYNERAAVSRILIPAILGGRTGDCYSPEEMGQLIDYLPRDVSLAAIREQFPEAFAACAKAFPALVRERLEKPLKILDRARHHLGETRRVEAARWELERAYSAGAGSCPLDTIGKLLNESHESLRDLYEVSTPEVETVIRILRSDPSVFGARLMGGGFGGNVLALTVAGHVSQLIERVESLYYQPRGSRGADHGAILVSTPGEGVSGLDPESAARGALERFSAGERDQERRRSEICGLLDGFAPDPAPAIRPIIVAAGRGERAKASGLGVQKPLARVRGISSILRVIEALRKACPSLGRPVVVVSPETEAPVREALSAVEAVLVSQPQAMGTADAVLCAREELREFKGLALVVWATQPVLRAETIRRSIALAALFPEFEMIVPTAMMEAPYAPVVRDEQGLVVAAHETHLERAEPAEHGESNVGVFILRAQEMFGRLEELRADLWDPAAARYRRPNGELGFPNEMIRRLAREPGGVFACPIANWREEKGIKTKADVELCERYLDELAELHRTRRGRR